MAPDSDSLGSEPAPIIRGRLVVGGLLVIVALVVGYLLATGLVARHHLQRVRYDVTQLRHALLASDEQAAHRWLLAAQSQARSAHTWLAGPVWSASADLPWVGRPARIERGLADVAQTLTDRALPAAVEAGDDLNPSRLRLPDGEIRAAVFSAAAGPLARATAATAAAARQLDALPGSTWLPPANNARRSAASLVDEFGRILRDARDASAVAPGMLGADGTRRYLLVVENDSESRGLGGLPGVMAVLTVSDGRLSFGQFENNEFLSLPPASPVPLPAAYRQTYAGTDVLTNFEDSDVSPDFPEVAPTWLAMWQARTGERLDGAIAADPTTLSYLLSATGPATLADGTEVSAHDIVALTEQRAYAQFDSLAARQAFFIQVAQAAAKQVVDGANGNAHALVDAMSRAVSEHRLVLWSADPTEQATLAETPLAGGLPQTSAPFVGVVVNNGQGSKLDYYLERSVTYDETGCTVSGQQLSTVTVQLHNAAPANLPAYVTTRLAAARHDPVGSERLFVALYATDGAQLLSVTDGGSPLSAFIGQEVGHPRYEVATDTDAGATTTLVFHLVEPRTSGSVVVWRQPGVRPETVQVTGSRCS